MTNKTYTINGKQFEIDLCLEQWELLLNKLKELDLNLDVLARLAKGDNKLSDGEVTVFIVGVLNKLIAGGSIKTILAIVLTEKGKEFTRTEAEANEQLMGRLKPAVVQEVLHDFFYGTMGSIKTFLQSMNASTQESGKQSGDTKANTEEETSSNPT